MTARDSLLMLVSTVLLSGLLSGTSVQCRPVKGSITNSSTGLPLANVVVKVLETGDSTQTDGTGTYLFPNIADGTYTMLFGRSTYSTYIKTNMIVGACCVGRTGNIDCDPGNGTDISDLSALIDNLYISFNPLCCPQSANSDGQPGIDISDLTTLIDYLYISFTLPALCQ